jgi:hypothetical protein
MSKLSYKENLEVAVESHRRKEQGKLTTKEGKYLFVSVSIV